MEKAKSELYDIKGIASLEKETASQNSYFAMFFGIGSGKLHTARRVQLVIWLQVSRAPPNGDIAMLNSRRSFKNGSALQESPYVWHKAQSCFKLVLTAIDAPTIFGIAGFDSQKAQWFSGLNDILYMV